MAEKTLSVRLSDDLQRKLNELRRDEEVIPDQSGMVRLLIERAFEAAVEAVQAKQERRK